MADHAAEKRPRRGACTLFQRVGRARPDVLLADVGRSPTYRTGSELMADRATEKRPRRGACTLFQQAPDASATTIPKGDRLRAHGRSRHREAPPARCLYPFSTRAASTSAPIPARRDQPSFGRRVSHAALTAAAHRRCSGRHSMLCSLHVIQRRLTKPFYWRESDL